MSEITQSFCIRDSGERTIEVSVNPGGNTAEFRLDNNVNSINIFINKKDVRALSEWLLDWAESIT